jgi:hypothetical protein
MNTKVIVGAVVVVVVVAGAAYFGSGGAGVDGGLMSSGIDKDSVMGKMKASGQEVMGASEYIKKCGESDKEIEDACYAMGALYYKDAGFCKYIKAGEATKNCNQATINNWYVDMQKTGATGFETGAVNPLNYGGGIIPGGEGNANIDYPGLEPEKPEAKTDLYTEAQAIAVPAGLPTELKAIFSEVCGSVKLTTDLQPNVMTGKMLVFVWKNKPTGEKIESAFIKAGYTVDLAGDLPFFKKGNVVIEVNWLDQIENQEIVVGIIPEE